MNENNKAPTPEERREMFADRDTLSALGQQLRVPAKDVLIAVNGLEARTAHLDEVIAAPPTVRVDVISGVTVATEDRGGAEQSVEGLVAHARWVRWAQPAPCVVAVAGVMDGQAHLVVLVEGEGLDARVLTEAGVVALAGRSYGVVGLAQGSGPDVDQYAVSLDLIRKEVEDGSNAK